MSSKAAPALLAAVSTVAALTLCEAAARFVRHRRASQTAAWTVIADGPTEAARVARYVETLAAGPGTDRRWFLEDPPPLPHRSAVSAETKRRYADYINRGILGPEAEYAWNRQFLEIERCAPGGFFRKYPETLRVFDAPGAHSRPRYRFPPNATTFAGLVTNEFGLRGPPLALGKPPGTIRIAFLGASTTICHHRFPFSYPERVVDWLNRFAAANLYPVRFEVLNGGREGLNSEDIARILLDELLPLAPDLAVYYEGANQFPAANDLLAPRIPQRTELDASDEIARHRIPAAIRTRFVLADLADNALRSETVGEPRKPAYRIDWPAGVDEQRPDPGNPRLPLKLPTIIGDLDAMRAGLRNVGGRLVLSSYIWLAWAGMPLSPARHKHIYEQLNTVLWPLRYGDVRRLADFQNRVFERYAAARGVDFLDIASQFPRDLNLFTDAIHTTETGDRLRAWIAFQQLVPVVRRLLDSGELPRAADPNRLPPPPSLAISESTTRCGDPPSQKLVRVDRSISLDTIALAYSGARVRPGRPVEVETAALPQSHAARLPIYIPPELPGPHYVFLRARVTAGAIDLSIPDAQLEHPQIARRLTTTAAAIDTYVPVPSPARARELIIGNGAEGAASRIVIEDAALLALSLPPPRETVRTYDLARLQSAAADVTIARDRMGIDVITLPVQYAHAGRLPLGLKSGDGEGLTLHVRARVIEGNMEFAILSVDGKRYLEERSAWPSTETTEVILPLPAPPVTGDLVIFSRAQGNVRSRAIIESIDVRRAR